MPPHIAAARTRLTGARSTLRDTCTITRTGPGGGTLDPDTGAITGATDTVYEGPCAWAPLGPGPQSQAGGEQRDLDSGQLLLPATATGVLNGDTVTVTSDDPDVAALDLVVVEVLARTTTVLRRIRCADRRRVRPGP